MVKRFKFTPTSWYQPRVGTLLDGCPAQDRPRRLACADPSRPALDPALDAGRRPPHQTPV